MPHNRKLACADFTFPLLAHDHVLDLVAMLGMDGVDIGLFEGKAHLQPATEFVDIPGSARTLFRKLDDRGLKVADIYLNLGDTFESAAINNPDSTVRALARETYRQTVEYALECSAKHITILPGTYFAGESKSDSLQRCIDELGWRISLAEEAGLVLGVEPHFGSIISTPEAAEELVLLTPGLTYTLDYCHFTRAGISDERAEVLIPYTSHIHVRAACEGVLQTSFVNNTIDYARIVRLLDEASYQGYLALEYVWIPWERCNEVDNLSETILMRDYLRSIGEKIDESLEEYQNGHSLEPLNLTTCQSQA